MPSYPTANGHEQLLYSCVGYRLPLVQLAHHLVAADNGTQR
jgi:hypothetical protein